MDYVDSCLTYQILLQDSGLAPAPELKDQEGNVIPWNVFEPHEGDIAHVDEDDKDYVFQNGEWRVKE